MTRYYVVSLHVLEQLLQTQRQALSRWGIDGRDLVQYSIHLATVSDYPTLVQYLSKDLGEHLTDFPPSAREFQQLLHQCMDLIQQAAALLVPFLTQVLGRFDHTVRLEKFLGADAIFSVQVCEYETIL